MSRSYQLTWDRGKLTEMERKTNLGLFKMGSDIAARARYNAPVKTGALRNSIRVTTEAGAIYVLAGGGRVPYARKREYENRLHPETTHYMGRAFADIYNSNWEETYFGDITL